MNGNRKGKAEAAMAMAIALLATIGTSAALADERAGEQAAPIVLAQAMTSGSSAVASRSNDALPAYEVKARAAAAEGPDALRRYIHRTRMIYALYYYDYAPGP